jgi:hypothetical protein
METANFLDAFTAAMAANGLTIWIVYCVWQMRRDPKDTRNTLTFLGLLGFVGIALYASTTG